MDRETEISLLRRAEFVDPSVVKNLLKSALTHAEVCFDSISKLKMQLRCNDNIAYVRWLFEDDEGTHVLTSMDDFLDLRVKALCRKLKVTDTIYCCSLNKDSVFEEICTHRMFLRASAVGVVFKKAKSMVVLKSRYGRADSTIINNLPNVLLDNDCMTALCRRSMY